jgi:hypothetical protein
MLISIVYVSSNVVNCPNIVNSSNVVNCPYKWAECSKLSNCCDKEKNKNKQKTNECTVDKSSKI